VQDITIHGKEQELKNARYAPPHYLDCGYWKNSHGHYTNQTQHTKHRLSITKTKGTSKINNNKKKKPRSINKKKKEKKKSDYQSCPRTKIAQNIVD
jgi:hypothetical protein